MSSSRFSWWGVAGWGMLALAAVGALWRGEGVDSGRVYRIGYGRDAPFHFKGEDGRATGLAVELVRAAASRQGIALEWVEDGSLRDGEVDLWVLMTLRPGRWRDLHFTEPYIQTHSCFVVPATSAVQRATDLAGARVSYLDFAIHRENVRRAVPGLTGVPADSSRAALREVVEGRADAAYLDEYSALPALLQGGFSTPLRTFSAGLPISRMAIASSQAAAAVADAIREEMQVMAREGLLIGIAENWGFFPNLTSDVIEGTARAKRWVKWLSGGISILGAMCLGMAGLFLRSRRQTRQLEQARERLAESEERWRTVVASEPECVALVDGGGRILEINPAGLAMFEARLEELQGRPASSLVASDQREALRSLLRGLTAGECRRGVLEGVGLKGRACWLEVVCSPLRPRSGGHREDALVIIARDITESRRMEAVLRERNRFIEAVMENSPIGFAVHDAATGAARFVSSRFEEIFAVSPGAVTSVETFLDLVFPDPGVRDEARGRILPDLASGDPCRMRWENIPLTLGTGETRYVTAVSTPVPQQGLIVSTVQDVTARVLAEEALARSEAELSAIHEQTPVMQCLLDGDLRVVRANRALGEYCGRPASELVGATCCELFSCRADAGCGVGESSADGPTPCALLESLHEVLATGVTVRSREIRMPGRCGATAREGTMLLSCSRAEVARQPTVLLLLDDVTRERQLAEQFRQAQKMEAIGLLAGGVAHDFNNILAAFLLNIDLMRQQEGLPGEIREGLDELEAGANRAARLTRQLLMFGRRSVLTPQLLDLNEVVENLRVMLGRLLGVGVRMVFNREAALPGVEADVGMLEQVLMNLVVNARDAMPEGGCITLTTSAVEYGAGDVLGHAARRPGVFVRLQVSDTGVGMDPATLGRIFEPFFTTKVPGKGTGLGLPTVHGIVSQHGGWVEVDSRVGGGTDFRIHLPAAARLVASRPRVVVGRPLRLPRDTTEGHDVGDQGAAIRPADVALAAATGPS